MIYALAEVIKDSKTVVDHEVPITYLQNCNNDRYWTSPAIKCGPGNCWTTTSAGKAGSMATLDGVEVSATTRGERVQVSSGPYSLRAPSV